MEAIGIIGGTSFAEWDEFKIEEEEEKHTPWGTPSSPLYKGSLHDEKIILLKRHGPDHDIPPHRINHRANVYALQKEVDAVIGICSAGSLRADIGVPSVGIPEDYVNFWNPPTFYDEEIKHVTPELSTDLRKKLIKSAENSGIETIYDDAVYVQTKGPRLETKAEVKILSNFGDLVGMTMASEATLCKECNIDYAGISTIDNYANGIKDETVDYEEIVETARDSWKEVKEIIESFLK